MASLWTLTSFERLSRLIILCYPFRHVDVSVLRRQLFEIELLSVTTRGGLGGEVAAGKNYFNAIRRKVLDLCDGRYQHVRQILAQPCTALWHFNAVDELPTLIKHLSVTVRRL